MPSSTRQVPLRTPGISFITFNDTGRIISQFDVFDLAQQMRLCDEREEHGLLSAELMKNRGIPMKRRLVGMRSANLA